MLLRPVPDPRDGLCSLLVRKTKSFSRPRQLRSSGIYPARVSLCIGPTRVAQGNEFAGFSGVDMGALAVLRCLTLMALFSKMAKDSVGCD
jgi:hypothetical protein